MSIRLPSGWIQVTPQSSAAVYLNTLHIVEINLDPNDGMTVLRFFEGSAVKIAETIPQVFNEMMTGQSLT